MIEFLMFDKERQENFWNSADLSLKLKLWNTIQNNKEYLDNAESSNKRSYRSNKSHSSSSSSNSSVPSQISEYEEEEDSIDPVLVSEAPRQIPVYIPDFKYTGLGNLKFDISKNQYK